MPSSSTCRRLAALGTLVVVSGCDGSSGGRALLDRAACPDPNQGSVVVRRELDLALAGLDEAGSLQADGSGGVWILDPSSRALGHFDSSGAVLARVDALGPAPWELETPQAIGVDSAGDVWVADARRARVVRFSPDGEFLKSVPTSAAIGATSIAVDGDNVFLSQRLQGGGGPEQAFVRGFSKRDSSRTEIRIDSASAARLSAEPFFDAPLLESVVAARPGGGVVSTYVVAYRLRWFDATGRLEREVAGCEGANNNADNLQSATMERGMSFKIFVSAMQFDADGHLTVVLTTPQRGAHRVDQYSSDGDLVRSMTLPSRSSGGIFLSAIVPGPSATTFWALDHLTGSVRLIEVGWPEESGASSVS